MNITNLEDGDLIYLKNGVIYEYNTANKNPIIDDKYYCYEIEKITRGQKPIYSTKQMDLKSFNATKKIKDDLFTDTQN